MNKNKRKDRGFWDIILANWSAWEIDNLEMYARTVESGIW